MTTEEFWELCPLKIYVNGMGGVVYCSQFERAMKEIGINQDLLHGCIEDNIGESDDPEDEDETIYWEQVEKEYKENLISK